MNAFGIQKCCIFEEISRLQLMNATTRSPLCSLLWSTIHRLEDTIVHHVTTIIHVSVWVSVSVVSPPEMHPDD
jgi:hypothetical protein